MSNRILFHLLKGSYLPRFPSKTTLKCCPQSTVGKFVGARNTEMTSLRSYCRNSDDHNEKKILYQNTDNTTITGKPGVPASISDSHASFKDRQRIVQDVIEEQMNPIEEELDIPETVLYKRGKTGVFDIDELVQLLHEERALDICVIKIPVELRYADYMILTTSQSPRHLSALATFVRKRFKSIELKSTDKLPKIEGERLCSDWLALDLGNIILHLFLHETRERVCLETLWTVGRQYDDLYHQKDTEIVQLLNMFQ